MNGIEGAEKQTYLLHFAPKNALKIATDSALAVSRSSFTTTLSNSGARDISCAALSIRSEIFPRYLSLFLEVVFREPQEAPERRALVRARQIVFLDLARPLHQYRIRPHRLQTIFFASDFRVP